MKRVYMFSEGNKEMGDLLGGKGANLAEMTVMGLPIPQGFTITTETCIEYESSGELTDEVIAEIDASMAELERISGKAFGDATNPLLVSVRSGSPVSMPGMMDTVLNLGLNETTVQALIEKTGSPHFGYNSYRRFIQMFADVVLGVDGKEFEHALERKRRDAGVELDKDLSAEHFQEIVEEFKRIVASAGQSWPDDPRQQLRLAIEAVFRSWDLERAVTYRNAHGIPHDLGTAVNVQAMVFGHLGDDSGTGVLFTRDPSTGKRELYGEFLMNAQGEDVVAGIRTPEPLSAMAGHLPGPYSELAEIAEKLEQHFRDMQDIEFTVEEGKLFMLQARSGKRTGQAAVKTAVDMVAEGLITRDEALLSVDPESLNQILHPGLDLSGSPQVIANGLAASPGAAVGEIVFTADEAKALKEEGRRVVLVSVETTPEDIHGMIAAEGILTSRGGMTSHAAVVARGMGTPCVCGCEAIQIGEDRFEIGGQVYEKGQWISLSGTTGNVYAGRLSTIDAEITSEFSEFLGWADEVRQLGVRTNADNPEDSQKARELGAEGIGLTRTEHMFMGDGRLPWVQKMIMSETEEARREALAHLLPFQREDFLGIFKAMDGLPVTIRLLDPPLHEFLPDRVELLVEVTKMRMEGASDAELAEKESILARATQLAESNPMLGLRGVRLGIFHPEVYEMQVRAIFEAARQAITEGADVHPEIMIPLVSMASEMRFMKELTHRIAGEMEVDFPYKVGTMIEIPRAAVTADEIAAEAEFFSFGTNDLTQMGFGFSRDDAEGKFFASYAERQVMPENPFVSLDGTGIGKLVRMASEDGRAARTDLKLGICGEHGGDPRSIEFVDGLIDYVSCSPFRVPIARLASAQAVLKRQ